ncbi:NADP-dependent oxidoreductase [Plantactinospora soyae]|uniref:NADPH:quinone reductase-like Zn-dependent oxidoreductase n=1 Tax=Plantactinospora soyae TaxID=1544732 RepID=A0A927QVA6_9ACTN|nr:NADP-dependent oxidoreductase [Plantactinospora soyae]MBE1485505.1 NADPH:quinone reductase-like Zn-dependent oxidoreductase [Plantactinospora soyae]
MRAVAVTALGGPGVLRVVERPDPVVGPGKVLVRIRAAGVQPADVAARVGLIPGGPIEPPFLLGWDFAGHVVAVGDDVTEHRPGGRVAGMVPWHLTRGTSGAYAEFVVADREWLVGVPDGMDMAAAATIALNALTARQALALLPLAPGSTLLVTGASGGVGGFAAQLAVRAGHRVVAVASHDDEAWVRGLGVADVVPRSADLAGLGPMPAVLDAVPLGAAAGAAVADGGTLVTTRPVPPLNPARGVRQHTVMVRLDRSMLAELMADVANGRLRTRVAASLPLAEAAHAHRLVEAGRLRGKIVLVP